MLKNKSNVVMLIIIITAIFVIGILFILNQKSNINKNATIEDIVIQEDKINIYVFWGEGCPKCEGLFQFFESIENKYGKYCNIYGFEIWNNKENEVLMKEMLAELNTSNENKAVPTCIIGDELLHGYVNSDNQKIKDTILSEYENRDNNLTFENIIKK